MDDLDIHACELGLVFGGQVAKTSRPAEPLRELALERLFGTAASDFLWQAPQGADVLHQSCNGGIGELRSIARDDLEYRKERSSGRDGNQFLGELTRTTNGMGAAWVGPAGEHIEADGQMKDSEPVIRFCRILMDF